MKILYWKCFLCLTVFLELTTGVGSVEFVRILSELLWVSSWYNYGLYSTVVILWRRRETSAHKPSGSQKPLRYQSSWALTADKRPKLAKSSVNLVAIRYPFNVDAIRETNSKGLDLVLGKASPKQPSMQTDIYRELMKVTFFARWMLRGWRILKDF